MRDLRASVTTAYEASRLLDDPELRKRVTRRCRLGTFGPAQFVGTASSSPFINLKEMAQGIFQENAHLAVLGNVGSWGPEACLAAL